ncbi:MAG: S9 family peptidase [Pseudomonadota bacterium]
MIAATGFAAPPVIDFVRYPEYQNVKLSPLGDRLAFTQRRGDGETLAVYDVAKKEILSASNFGGRNDVKNFFWAHNDRLIVQPGRRFSQFLEGKVATGELFGLNANGRGMRMLFGFGAGEQQLGSKIKKRESELSYATLLDRYPEQKHKIIIQKEPLDRSGPYAKAVLLDVRNGNQRDLATGPLRYGRFVPDGRGNVAAFYGTNAEGYAVSYWRENGKSRFTQIGDPKADYPVPRTAIPGTNEFWSVGRRDADTLGLFRWNPAQNSLKSVFRRDNEDFGGLMFTDDNRLWGIWYQEHYPEYQYLSSEDPVAKAHVGIRQAFPEDDVYFATFSEDGSKAVVRVEGPKRPTEFYLFEFSTNELNPLAQSRPALSAIRDQLAEVEPFELKARDGLMLRGYTTLTAGKGPRPFVVLVHGGPHGVQDYWGFDSEAQLLASRGYGVMQLNYRGSGGTGSDFMSAGYGEWGAKMQDDITDATRWLIKEGLAESDKICIMGASFGAYASLMGVAREPDLYRCAIGIAGVYDLPLMYKRGDILQLNYGKSYLEDVLGTDMADLERRSPVNHASRIKAKVLLAHGNQDQRAPLEHATRMRDALKQAGNAPVWIQERREGHGFGGVENRTELYTQVLDFLAANLGGERALAAGR